jgi:hypothetical protein
MEKASHGIARGTNRTHCRPQEYPVCGSWEDHIDAELCSDMESTCGLGQ